MYAPKLGIPVTKAPETPGWDVSKARDPAMCESLHYANGGVFVSAEGRAATQRHSHLLG